jgi:murein DD-endopeptidase MepM/ murein hydrolase activator NlpD
MPGTYRIGSRFGSRPDPFTGAASFHAGVDLKAPAGVTPEEWARAGQPVLAVGSGTVTEARRSESAGWLVRIELDAPRGRVSVMHLREAPPVVVGDRVATGQRIGMVGNTGKSTAAHLHIEWKPEGAAGAVDPLPMWPHESEALP